MSELLARMGSDKTANEQPVVNRSTSAARAIGNRPRRQSRRAVSRIWVGSIGYERFKDNRVFVDHLRRAGVRRLIDVRELAISRRRGYAKSELKAATGVAGIEYVHVPKLGNPKEFRDLYKSGNHVAGRAGYEQLLLSERRGELEALIEALKGKQSALMCVEHDYLVCHRKVILDALRSEFGLSLRVGKIR